MPVRNEHGFVLVFVSLGCLVLAGLAGLSVDLGNWYLHIQKAQNAADAAALDASPYIPGSFSTAQTVIEATLEQNGIDPTTAHIASITTTRSGGQSCSQQVTSDPSEVHVQIQVKIPSTFIQLLGGPGSVTFSRSATAGYFAPVSAPLANYSNVLGTEPAPPCGCNDFPESWGDVPFTSIMAPGGPLNDPYNQNFRLHIDGTSTSKANGDRFATQPCAGVAGVSPDNCSVASSPANLDYTASGYDYTVHIDPGAPAADQYLIIEAYDPAFIYAPICPTPGGEPDKNSGEQLEYCSGAADTTETGAAPAVAPTTNFDIIDAKTGANLDTQCNIVEPAGSRSLNTFPGDPNPSGNEPLSSSASWNYFHRWVPICASLPINPATGTDVIVRVTTGTGDGENKLRLTGSRLDGGREF